MINLTSAEEEHIKLIRAAKIEFGRVPMVVYFQDWKAVRIEYERAIVSQMARKDKE